MSRKILIIDDDEEMCEELSEVLSGEGYEVKSVHTGLEGKDLILDSSYDIILLDIKLPGLTGYDLLKLTRGRKRKNKLFVVTGRPLKKEFVKTDNPSEEEEEKLLKLADGVINKPFDIETILTTIKDSLA
jgi:DNA-binding response OmpR family regulator